MALDIGKLVGYIELDASGAARGVQQANQAIAQGGRQWAQTAGQAGEKAGTEGGTRMSTALNNTVGKIPGQLKTAFVGFGAGIVGALGVNAVVDYARDAIGAASDLEQSIGGVDAVFGRYADNVHTNAARADQALGLSKNAYNELVTVAGALLKNKGLQDYADQAENVLRIGADLAAQFGGPTSQAVEALNAALRGESDPIERYGISLNETAVNAKLAEEGLSGLEGKALETAKTQARLLLITEQSADAQGAFAREADTAAGKAERQQAKLDNLQAAIGERLMPVYHAWLDFMNTHGIPALEGFSDGLLTVLESLGPVVDMGADALAFFQGLPAPLQAAAAAIAGLKLANLLGLTDFLKGLGSGVASGAREGLDGVRLQAMYMGDAFKGAEGKAAGLRAALGTGARAGLRGALTGLRGAASGLVGLFGGPWGLALAGAATAVGFWMQSQKDAERQVDELRQTLDEQTGALTENSEAWFKKELQDSGAYDAADRLGIPLDLATQAAMGQSEALAILNPRLAELKERVDAARQSDKRGLGQEQLINDFDTLTGVIDGSNEKLADARDELDQWQRASGEAGGATLDLAGKAGEMASALASAASEAEPLDEELNSLQEAAEDAAEAHDDLVDSLLRIVDNAVSAEQAAIDYEESLDNLTETIKENGKNHDISTEKGRANQEALLAVAAAAKEEAAANLANGDSLFSVQKSMDDARESFIKGARQMGYTKKEAEELADRLGLTDEHVNTLSASIERVPSKHVDVTVGGVEDATRNVQILKGAIDAVTGKTVNVYVVTNWSERGRRPVYTGGVSAAVATGGYMADVIGLASGGWPRRQGLVTGPGGPTDDLVPARLSTSEFVTRAAAVRKAGVDVMYAINSGRFDRDNLRAAVGLAGGGTAWAPAAAGATAAGGGVDYATLARVVAAEVTAAIRHVNVNTYLDGFLLSERGIGPVGGVKTSRGGNR